MNEDLPQHRNNIHNGSRRVLAHAVWQVDAQQAIILEFLPNDSPKDFLKLFLQLWRHWSYLDCILRARLCDVRLRPQEVHRRHWEHDRLLLPRFLLKLTCPTSGVRPGPYWQIMWRFVSPALMSAVIASSIYFMLTNNPKYSAWNKEQVRHEAFNFQSRLKAKLFFLQNQAKSEDREYSHTGLVFAFILAISSLVPIAGGAILHVFRRFVFGTFWLLSILFLLASVYCDDFRWKSCCYSSSSHPTQSTSGCRTRTITSLRWSTASTPTPPHIRWCPTLRWKSIIFQSNCKECQPSSLGNKVSIISVATKKP